ncbi:MAG TPA: hypothetical protein PK543_03150 [Candidatus Saccharibacteria bacterium]|nr:hypothetical protein [Candidatus Saccharibacteria bacterium]HRQ87071.1 hypothetical protein [Candidatus Saccharibacteria bacterium]
MAEKIPVFIPPFNKVEMIHRLLLSYAVGRAEEYDLLVDSFNQLDGVRPDDYYERFYKQLGVSEDAPDGLLLILEAQRRLAAKAMQAVIQFYELNKEEIQTNAHYFNDRM